jgi:hypothetical protein
LVVVVLDVKITLLVLFLAQILFWLQPLQQAVVAAVILDSMQTRVVLAAVVEHAILVEAQMVLLEHQVKEIQVEILLSMMEPQPKVVVEVEVHLLLVETGHLELVAMVEQVQHQVSQVHL